MTFDGDGRITQVRQSWDQGALLKQLDVIGRTGRNWPIRDSNEQIKLIASSLKAAGGPTARPSSSELANRSRGNSTNILRDPHASLALFAPREDHGNLPEAVVSPYAGSRPRQRSFAELVGNEAQDEPASPSNGRERSQSPSKAIAPKFGAGKNYHPNRLFDTDEGVESTPDTPEKASSNRFYRPNPTKYHHFNIADGSESQDPPKAAVASEQPIKSKHGSNWSFDDFVTPQKPAATRGLQQRPQDVRHWGNDNTELAETPAKNPQQIKPRRDAETHFEFRDDGMPPNEDRMVGRPRGAGLNTGLGLYQNNLYNEDGNPPTPGPDPRALGNITNLKDRRKDFDAHFDITDDQPSQSNASSQTTGGDAAKVSDDRMKAVKMMESHWGAYEEPPASQKENSNPDRSRVDAGDNRGINIAGDGMGGRKGAGRGWSIGHDSDDDPTLQAVPGKKPGSAHNSTTIWDF